MGKKQYEKGIILRPDAPDWFKNPFKRMLRRWAASEDEWRFYCNFIDASTVEQKVERDMKQFRASQAPIFLQLRYPQIWRMYIRNKRWRIFKRIMLALLFILLIVWLIAAWME